MNNKKLYHGACWYPELWDSNTLQQDIQKMKSAGINLVRLGEFMWSTYEPYEGEFHFELLLSVLDTLYAEGIDVVLCTPTPTPPVWVSYGKSELSHVTSSGQTMIHGSRQHLCTNNKEFRSKVRRIVIELASRVADHSAVVLWQLDNEFKCHVSECFCSSCKEQWHQWLQKRYTTIDTLNSLWKTHMWSEYYQSFEQIPQPFTNTPFIHHASLNTMYRLFHREKIAEYAAMQAQIIRQYSVAPITTNTGMGFFLDNEALFAPLDCVGFDTYASYEQLAAYTLNCNLWRNIKLEQPYWLLESSSSHTGALDRHAVPHPAGYLKAEALASYALGGVCFSYWLWRQQPTGSEISHSAVLTSWGTEGPGYQDVLEVSALRQQVEPLMLATQCVFADIAIGYSDRSKAFMETESHKKNQYRALITHIEELFLEEGVHHDWVPESTVLQGQLSTVIQGRLPENSDLEQQSAESEQALSHKILWTPYMFHLSSEYITQAEQFVRNGGIWIIGPMTSIRTKEHTVHLDKGLGEKLETLAGVKTCYTIHIEGRTTEHQAVGTAFGVSAPLSLYSAVFDAELAEGTQPIGTITDGVANGKLFLTERKVGKGKIVMLGSLPAGKDGDKMLRKMIMHYAREVEVAMPITVDPGVLVVPRQVTPEQSEFEAGAYYVLINMRNETKTFSLAQRYKDFYRNQILESGSYKLAGFDYKVLYKAEDKEQ